MCILEGRDPISVFSMWITKCIVPPLLLICQTTAAAYQIHRYIDIMLSIYHIYIDLIYLCNRYTRIDKWNKLHVIHIHTYICVT